MDRVSGNYALGEADTATNAIRARQGASIWPPMLVLFAFIGGGSALGTWISYRFNTSFGVIFGALVAGALAMPLMRRMGQAGLRRAMQARGLPTHVEVTIELTPEALVRRAGDTVVIAPWSNVTDLFFHRPYWIFMAFGAPIPVPRRFFADETEEIEFLQRALHLMSEGARQRSPEAVKRAGIF